MIASSGLMRKCEQIWDAATERFSCPVERAGKKRIHLYFNAALWEKALAGTPPPRPAPRHSSSSVQRWLQPSMLGVSCCGLSGEVSLSMRLLCIWTSTLALSNSIWDQPMCRRGSPELLFLFLFVLSEVEIQQHDDEKIFISYILGMWQICFICTGLRQFQLHRL